MSIDPQIFQELYALLESLGLVSCRVAPPGAKRLTAPAGNPVQIRSTERSDGAVVVTLAQFEVFSGHQGASPNPVIQLAAFPQMAVAEVTRLVHHADYALDPVGEHGQVRPLVMRLAMVYSRRWLRQLVAAGYCAEQPACPAAGPREPQRVVERREFPHLAHAASRH